MLSLYISKQTWLHAQPARGKLLVLAASSLGMMSVSSLSISVAALTVVLLLYGSLGEVGLNRLAQSLRTLVWLIVFIATAQILVAVVQQALSVPLIRAIGVAISKLTTLVLLAELVTITTPIQSLMSAITPLLRPFRVLGLSPERLALGIGLLVRMAGLQRGVWLRLEQAWRARGLGKPGFKIVAPSLRAGLRHSDQMATALHARTALADSAASLPALRV